LPGLTSGRPVVSAIRSTAPAIADDGRLSTHSPCRCRLAAVWLLSPMPSIADWPSHHADDIGARFAVPSGLSVLTSTTGVPK